MYTRLKKADAEKVGISFTAIEMSLRQADKEWREAVFEMVENPNIDGVLVQKPSYAAFAAARGSEKNFDRWWLPLIELLPIDKDIDGLSPQCLWNLETKVQRVSSGNFWTWESLERDFVLPATAKAVVEIALLATAPESDLPVAAAERLALLQGSKVVVIGRSRIVGRPAAAAFKLLGSQTSLISSSADLPALLADADVVVSAAGRSRFILPEWLKPGVVAIDVGAPDPEFAPGIEKIASFVTPVPGGVGPLTRLCLLESLLGGGDSS